MNQNRNLDSLVQDAQKRAAEYDNKVCGLNESPVCMCVCVCVVLGEIQGKRTSITYNIVVLAVTDSIDML